MKELNELSAWTDSILNEFVRPSKNDKPVELKRDIKTLAQHKYPSYDAEDALALFVADKLEDFEKQNAEQNKVINTQGKMLTKKIDALGQAEEELRSVQDHSQQELERIKALSTQKKSDLQTTVASRQEVEQLLQQVEQLRSKPGVSSEQYSELKQQIEAQAKKGIDTEKLQALEKQIADIGDQREVGRDQLARISSMADELDAKQLEIAGNEAELVKRINDLEQRHGELINKEQELDSRDAERQSRFEEYKEKFANFGNKVNSRLDQIEPEVQKQDEINKNQEEEIDELQRELHVTAGRTKVFNPDKTVKFDTGIMRKLVNARPQDVSKYFDTKGPNYSRLITRGVDEMLKPSVTTMAARIRKYLDDSNDKFDLPEFSYTDFYNDLSKVLMPVLNHGASIRGDSPQFLKLYDDYLLNNYIPKVLSMAQVDDPRQVKKLTKGIMSHVSQVNEAVTKRNFSKSSNDDEAAIGDLEQRLQNLEKKDQELDIKDKQLSDTDIRILSRINALDNSLEDTNQSTTKTTDRVTLPKVKVNYPITSRATKNYTSSFVDTIPAAYEKNTFATKSKYDLINKRASQLDYYSQMSGHLGDYKIRLVNLLVKNDKDGNPKSPKIINRDLAKARMIIKTLVNQNLNLISNLTHQATKNPDRYGSNFKYTGGIDNKKVTTPVNYPDGALKLFNKFRNLWYSFYKELEIRSGIKITDIWPEAYDYIPGTIVGPLQRKHGSQGRTMPAGTLMNPLPESISNDIESIAENILGPQYAKYLK